MKVIEQINMKYKSYWTNKYEIWKLYPYNYDRIQRNIEKIMLRDKI